MKNLNIKKNLSQRVATLAFAITFITFSSYARETPSTHKIIEATTNTQQIMESWKSEISEWSLKSQNFIFEEEREESIPLEDWMLSANDSFWHFSGEEVEDEIEIEDWMLDLNAWK